jgi:hypothetical protein
LRKVDKDSRPGGVVLRAMLHLANLAEISAAYLSVRYRSSPGETSLRTSSSGDSDG